MARYGETGLEGGTAGGMVGQVKYRVVQGRDLHKTLSELRNPAE
jgi:hypothetical protein